MDYILDLFSRWMAFCLGDVPSRLLNRSVLWVIVFVLGAGMTVAFPFVAAYYPFEQWLQFVKYFCGFELLMMAVIVRETFKVWLAKSDQEWRKDHGNQN